MELHHRSCILPSNAPALPDTEAYIPSRVLQERSANRVHEYSDGSLSRKRSPSYAGRLDGYFTGNLGSYFQGDRSEAQVEIETRKLLKLLKKCDKYQKYRERQRSDSAEKDQTWPDSLEEAFWRGEPLCLCSFIIAYSFSPRKIPTNGSQEKITTWAIAR